MSELLVLPIILPLIGGAAAVVVRGSARQSLYLALTIATLHTIAAGLLIYQVHTGGIFATQIGNWPAPFGITLVADRLSAVMVMITAVINLAVTSYSKADIGIDFVRRGHYCLLQILVGGDLRRIYNRRHFQPLRLVRSDADGILRTAGARPEQDPIGRWGQICRFFTLVFVIDAAYLNYLLPTLAALTMITGVLGAAAQNEFRRILSFHIISQVGYMVLGLSLQSRLALAGTVFYLVHHIVVKANLFLVSGVVKQLQGSFELARLGGIYRSNGWIAALFFIPAFSLAGFPPLSGFWAKMILIRASLDSHQYWLAVIAAVVGLLTVYSMTKIWGEVFWKPAPAANHEADRLPARSISAWMLVPVTALTALTIVIGLGAELVFQFAWQAAEELSQPAEYVRAVMKK